MPFFYKPLVDKNLMEFTKIHIKKKEKCVISKKDPYFILATNTNDPQ